MDGRLGRGGALRRAYFLRRALLLRRSLFLHVFLGHAFRRCRALCLPGLCAILLAANGSLCLPGWAQQAAGERVAGRVVSALDGHPLAQARLSLEDTKTDKVVTETVAGPEGGFRFEAVPAGRYRLTGRARGYLQTAYLQHGPLSSAVVTGEGFATGSLLLQLAPSASIEGHVFSDAGEPVERASVSLYREDPAAAAERVRRVNTTATGDDGRYAFRNLGEGRYFVSASGTPWYAVHAADDAQSNGMPYRTAVDPALDVAYPTVFYPGALRAEQATALLLRGGEQVTADMQMRPVPAVTVTVQGLPGADPNRVPMPTLTRSIFGTQERVPVQGAVINGVLQISGLAPGEYTVQQLGDGNRAPVDVQTIDLTTGSSTALLAAAAPDTTTVIVQVEPQPGAALPAGLAGFQINLRDLRRERRFASGTVNEKGIAEFTHVPAGEYRPVLFHDGRQMALAGVTVQGQPVTDRQIRVIGHEAESAVLQVKVMMAGGPITVTGVAERKGRPAVEVVLILVPAGADTGQDLFRRDQTDLDGGFTFPNIAPGTYIAVAIEEGWNLSWTDVHTLSKYLAQGVPVAVSAGAEQTIRLKEPVIVQPQ